MKKKSLKDISLFLTMHILYVSKTISLKNSKKKNHAKLEL